MTQELFEHFWQKANLEETPLIDWSKVAYSEWTAIDQEYDIPSRFYGTRGLETGEPVGIVRKIVPDGLMHEATYNTDGKIFGLSRLIWGSCPPSN